MHTWNVTKWQKKTEGNVCSSPSPAPLSLDRVKPVMRFGLDPLTRHLAFVTGRQWQSWPPRMEVCMSVARMVKRAGLTPITYICCRWTCRFSVQHPALCTVCTAYQPVHHVHDSHVQTLRSLLILSVRGPRQPTRVELYQQNFGTQRLC